jgi:hypothetical protein
MQSAINAHRHENGRLHAARKVARRPASGMALWRSGDAADCKSVYAGSIPAGASRPSSIDGIPCIHAVFPQAPPCAGRKFRSLTKKYEFSASRLGRVNQFRRLLTCLLLETPTITQRLGGRHFLSPALFLCVFQLRSERIMLFSASEGLNRWSGLVIAPLRLFRDSSVGRAGDC